MRKFILAFALLAPLAASVTAKSLGEVADLEPGKSGELTLDLKPGYYALFCIIQGHYMAGMWKIIAVQQAASSRSPEVSAGSRTGTPRAL